MVNLQLSLKRQWFELTKAGVKTKDYFESSIQRVKAALQTQSLF